MNGSQFQTIRDEFIHRRQAFHPNTEQETAQRDSPYSSSSSSCARLLLSSMQLSSSNAKMSSFVFIVFITVVSECISSKAKYGSMKWFMSSAWVRAKFHFRLWRLACRKRIHRDVRHCETQNTHWLRSTPEENQDWPLISLFYHYKITTGWTVIFKLSWPLDVLTRWMVGPMGSLELFSVIQSLFPTSWNECDFLFLSAVDEKPPPFLSARSGEQPWSRASGWG